MSDNYDDQPFTDPHDDGHQHHDHHDHHLDPADDSHELTPDHPHDDLWADETDADAAPWDDHDAPGHDAPADAPGHDDQTATHPDDEGVDWAEVAAADVAELLDHGDELDLDQWLAASEQPGGAQLDDPHGDRQPGDDTLDTWLHTGPDDGPADPVTVADRVVDRLLGRTEP